MQKCSSNTEGCGFVKNTVANAPAYKQGRRAGDIQQDSVYRMKFVMKIRTTATGAIQRIRK